MKNISSKKLVSAIVISGISLQVIPFNAFAASSLSSATEIERTSKVNRSTTILDNMISLRGSFESSNPIKVNMRFEEKNREGKQIVLDIGNSKVNPEYGNRTYMSVQLLDKFGNVKNSFSLRGNDYPNINESVKKFNGQEYENGDFLKITHEEPEKNVIIYGTVGGTQDNSSRGVSKDTLENSFFKITEGGLQLVKDKATTEVTGSTWTNDQGFDIKGDAETIFASTEGSCKKQLVIKDERGEVIENIEIKSTNKNSKDADNNNEFEVKIPKEDLLKIKPGTYNLYVKIDQNGRTYEQPLKQDSIQNSIEPKDIHFKQDINNTDDLTLYDLSKPSPRHGFKYNFKTNTNNEVQLEVTPK